MNFQNHLFTNNSQLNSVKVYLFLQKLIFQVVKESSLSPSTKRESRRAQQAQDHP